MVQAFHSSDFYRVRLGVGRPSGRWENVDFLLEPFAKRELEDVAVMVEQGAEASLSLVTKGLSVTQSLYTRGPGIRER